MMRRYLLASILVATSTLAFAEGIDGVWRTETSDTGGHLEVTISPCDFEAAKTCGEITAAYSKDSVEPDTDYENLGKLMIKDMESEDGISFSGGTVWDPEKDKTYKSKLKLNGDDLEVEGCIAFVCIGQDWTRVK